MGHASDQALSLARVPYTVSHLLTPLCADSPLEFEPSTTVLHYAQTVFEGMKAYKDPNGHVRIFRPNMNMKRMNTSAS